MDMELLNAISTMLDERFEKNNEILRQETKEMIAENNKVLLNQFTAVIEEKVTKEIHLIAEGHTALLEKLDMSREAFLRMYLQNLAVLNELTLLDDKYQNILSVNAEALASVASELQKLRNSLEKKEE